jgi:hypothetical protein
MGASMDRINNDGNYEPGNVRWADARLQASNQRRNRRITAQGRTMILAEWARELGATSHKIIAKRIKLGWSPEDAVTTPVGQKRRP